MFSAVSKCILVTYNPWNGKTVRIAHYLCIVIGHLSMDVYVPVYHAWGVIDIDWNKLIAIKSQLS